MPTALITGAARGLGSAIAAELAPTHKLVLCGRPSERLDDLAASLGATTYPLDLADADSIPAIAEVIDELDVLVHNAGVGYPAKFADSSIEEWRSTFAVNVMAPVALTRALLPVLRAACGQVVFINGGAGRTVLAGMASYSASKFAQRAFADSLRQEESALRVTTVFPGRIDTEMQRDMVAFEGQAYDPAAFMRAVTVARVIANIVATPLDAHMHEVVIRHR